MHINIPNPSRRSLIAFVTLSLVLHLFVCKLPVQSMKLHEDPIQVVQVSLVSVAAPSVIGNADINEQKNNTEKKDISKIEPAADKGIFQPKQSQQNKTKASLTSNDKGKDAVTVKTLSASDYIQTVAPVYPPRAIERGFEGVVVVKALISSNGLAKNVDVASSSGHQLLDASAIKAVSQWKFKQSALDKATAEMWVQVPVRFIIR